MKTKQNSATEMLLGMEVSVLDAARFILNILDFKPAETKLSGVQFVSKVIECGLRNIRTKEMSVENGLALYLESKKHLRSDSLRDIRCIGKRLLKINPELGRRNFSELSLSDCEEWLSTSLTTAPQFNKARTMLHGLFEFAIRREWCDRNPIKRIERKKVIEKEIRPLKLSETKRLVKAAESQKDSKCAVAAALLIYAGIRPREVRRLKWFDIDTEENVITVRSQCSKTGGVRQVEIPPALKRILLNHRQESDSSVCPADWEKRWRKIRDSSGFSGNWVQDVLRHTYASHHAKFYSDLPRLQINMGHGDLSLLRSRYVNMRGISRSDAKNFFC